MTCECRADLLRQFVCCLGFAVLSFGSRSSDAAEREIFPTFADDHTVGLWLFDEANYPYTTLTDASRYEHDLRLMPGGGLVAGRFGNAFASTPGDDAATSYAAWKGMVAFTYMREVSGRPGSGLWGPTVAPEKLLDALASRNFTCEFWMLSLSDPTEEVVLIDLGDRYGPGFTVTLEEGAAAFVVENAYAGFRARCPLLKWQLGGRSWHHVAFTCSSGGNALRYFVDGKRQTDAPVVAVAEAKVPPAVWPESLHHTTYAETTQSVFQKKNRRAKADLEGRRRHRFNFSLGRDRQRGRVFHGNLDELRFSNLPRYTDDFSLPDSFSRNHGRNAPAPIHANGPPLLFGSSDPADPARAVELGSRKHVFIDDVLLEKQRDLRLQVNSPTDVRDTNVKIRSSFDIPFLEHEGKIWMFDKTGYGSDAGESGVLFSQDGLEFSKPDLGVVERDGSLQNNSVLLHAPSWGRFFEDTRPDVPPEERFKYTAWVAQRGIYLYLSPDGIHWRRNETCMLPLVSGGGSETFWDDQRGLYVSLLKRDGSYSTGEFPAYGRGATLFETREVTRAWPFRAMENPYYEGWAMPAVTGEGITVMGPNLFDPNRGQIFRTRVRKYLWAPDTYVAFLVRNHRHELAVSRDGIRWRIYEDEGDAPYIDRGMTSGGWIQDGLVRRGDVLWHYLNRQRGTVARLSQRLDGFVSLDAGEKVGEFISRPLRFTGKRLVLNVNAAKGSVRVALLDLSGKELTGFHVGLNESPRHELRGYGLAHCDPIQGDSVRHVVTWRGLPEVGNLAGRVVRLRVEMQNAKLYALQFE